MPGETGFLTLLGFTAAFALIGTLAPFGIITSNLAVALAAAGGGIGVIGDAIYALNDKLESPDG